MRKCLTLIGFVLSISHTSAFSQEITLKDLQKLSSFKIIDSIDTYLNAKGYNFLSTVKVEGDPNDTLDYAFKHSENSNYKIYISKHNYGFYEVDYDINTNEKLFYELKDACAKLKNIKLIEERTESYDQQHLNTALFRSYYDGKFQYGFTIATYKNNSPNQYNIQIFIIKPEDISKLKN